MHFIFIEKTEWISSKRAWIVKKLTNIVKAFFFDVINSVNSDFKPLNKYAFRQHQAKEACAVSYHIVLEGPEKTRKTKCNNSNTLYSVKPLYNPLFYFGLKISQVLKYKEA